MPGESYLAVLDALHDSAVRMVVCRQEGGAAYMAEAYGKLTGRPGVCLVTRGPGASNALVGLHTAEQDGTPLLLCVGLVPRGHSDRFAFQEMDLRAVFGSVAKAVEVCADAARLPEYLARAMAVAASGRPGPVVLGIPEDVLADTASVPDAEPLPIPSGGVGEPELDRLARLLAQAERPLLFLGGSRWTEPAREDLRAWAEAWELPVAVDFRCQDLIPDDSPVHIGNFGYGRSPRLARRLAETDLLLCVGTAPGDVATEGYTLLDEAGTRIVQVLPYDQPPGVLYRAELALLATPEAFGAAVRRRLPAPEGPGPLPWSARTKRDRADRLDFRAPVHNEEDELDLGSCVEELDARLPGDAVITFGAGNYSHWAQRFLTYHAGTRQLGPRNGSMGYGLPAAVAASIEYPGRRVVCFAGDGCFLMNGQELATAVGEGAAPLILVLENGTYGTIRMHQERAYPGRVSGTALTNPDFAALARAYGAFGEAVTATAEFAPALDRALAAVDAGRPALLALRMARGRLGPELRVAE